MQRIDRAGNFFSLYRPDVVYNAVPSGVNEAAKRALMARMQELCNSHRHYDALRKYQETGDLLSFVTEDEQCTYKGNTATLATRRLEGIMRWCTNQIDNDPEFQRLLIEHEDVL